MGVPLLTWGSVEDGGVTVKPWVGPAGPGLGRPGRLTTWSKERGKRQLEFGMEMQSNEVSGRNANSPEAGGTGSLVQSAPAQGIINDCLWRVEGGGWRAEPEGEGWWVAWEGGRLRVEGELEILKHYPQIFAASSKFSSSSSYSVAPCCGVAAGLC